MLCEAISVIVRRYSIDQYYDGGWDAFFEDVPHAKMCTDGELVSVGFWDTETAELYVDFLETKGLQYESEKAIFDVFDRSRERNDIAIIDQSEGLSKPCVWVQKMKGKIGKPAVEVLLAWLYDGHKINNSINLTEAQYRAKSIDIHTPPGWTPESSIGLLRKETEQFEQDFEYVEAKNGEDAYRDKVTGKLWYKPR